MTRSFLLVLLFQWFNISSSFGQLEVYTDRAAWEAALSNLVNEDLESVTADINLLNNSTNVGSHTFAGTASCCGSIWLDVPPLDGNALFPNTNQIVMGGTTGGTPKTTVTIPNSYGIGFDWATTATSTGLHNSLYLTVSGTSGSLTRLLNPTSAGLKTGFIGIISPCGGITTYQAYTTRANFQGFSLDNFSYATALITEPAEIDVQGNSVSILDDDVTPNTADHTDFGNALVIGGTVVRTFTIQNTGSSDLIVSSITKSGAHQADYLIGLLTPASPIPAGMSATFTVTFDPSAGGIRNAGIVINNNDCNEKSYDYSIQGNGVTCADSDGDGICDDEDNCPTTSNENQADADGDGIGDVCDGCPNDANKTAPGICGCGVADTDTDNDGTADCNDGCPNDANKTAPGQCGCGVPDTDTDGDGTADCNDACPNDPDNDADGDGLCSDVDNCPDVANANQADLDQDGLGDACDTQLSVCDVLNAMEDAITASGIPSNLKSALKNKLDQAKTKYENGNNNGAIGSLNGFINQVTNNPNIPAALRNEWIANAQAIIAAIEGGNSNCTNGGRPSGRNKVKEEDLRSGAMEFEIMPNPASDEITIQFQDNSTLAVLKITNPFGKTVLTQQVENGEREITLDLSGRGFCSGVYFVSIRVEGQTITQRLIITKK